MNFLLFLISLIFSFIFYIFHNLSILWKLLWGNKYIYLNFTPSSLSWNLLIESLIFLIIGFSFFILFSSFFVRKPKINTTPYLKNWLKKNFKIILYYIGFILFYVSISMMLKKLNFNFAYIILFINILIITTFFISSRFFILADLLKINNVIFSSVYIFLFINTFIIKQYDFLTVDFINSVIILFSFFIILYRDKVLLKNKSDSFVLINFFTYSFFFVSFYFSLIFNNVSFIFSFISFFLNILIFYLLSKISFLKNSKITLTVLWIFLSYISIVSGIYYLLFYNILYLELIVIPILFYSAFFNFKIHKLYENYTSFFFFFISFYFILFYIYHNYIYLINHNDLNLVFYSFTISLITSLSTYLHKYKRIYDYYIMYFISLLISIVATVYYFYINPFDLFNLWIILLYDSVLVFLSYNKLRKIEN